MKKLPPGLPGQSNIGKPVMSERRTTGTQSPGKRSMATGVKGGPGQMNVGKSLKK